MKFKIFLRPSLAVVFGFIGALVARGGTPPAIFVITGDYFLAAAVLAFGTLGFILPELVELAWKTGIAAVARQIVIHLPTAELVGRLPHPTLRIGRRGAAKKYLNPLILDTSVLVDGRLVDIARTGFIFGTFVVIPAVVSELHSLSDSASDLKRARGRRGLDVLASLKKEKKVKVELVGRDPAGQTVDEKLVSAAKSFSGKLVTVDFNLNKVASVRGISVANLNELANAVKTAVLPHETLRIKINSAGRERSQGVGYLPDGTMVVVEEGAELIGKMVNVVVLRIIQTAAGKMIFGKIAS